MSPDPVRRFSLARRPRRAGFLVRGGGRRAAGLAAAASLAVAAVAAAQTADSAAYGQRIELTLLEVGGGAVEIESGPAPLAAGAAPPAYDLAGGAAATRVDGPGRLGTLLTAGPIAVGARSALPALDDAEAGATLEAVHLSLGGRLTLDAEAVTASAEVLPEDGETCWSGTAAGGGATFVEAALGGGLIPVRIPLPPAPPPNHLLFDRPGEVSVILNEQVVDDGRASVHAVHIRVEGLAIDGVGLLAGDVYLGHADAAVGCGGAKVAVSVADLPDPGTVGAIVTYTATVSNDGPERALDVLLGAPLPVAVEPVSATPSQGQCAIVGRDVACSLGDVRAGETATVDLAVTPVHSGAVAVQVEAAATNDDAFPENNHASETTRVHGQGTFDVADLGVELADSADPIEIGRTLTYTLTVRHDGGKTVSSALATLELPFGLELLSVVPGQGSCAGDPTVVCDLGALAAGQQATVTVGVLVARGGVLEATAVVSSSVTDPEVADNEVVESTQVEDPPA
jgi:uncharacterized repeat protein (TIGR01451 family)